MSQREQQWAQDTDLSGADGDGDAVSHSLTGEEVQQPVNHGSADCFLLQMYQAQVENRGNGVLWRVVWLVSKLESVKYGRH